MKKKLLTFALLSLGLTGCGGTSSGNVPSTDNGGNKTSTTDKKSDVSKDTTEVTGPKDFYMESELTNLDGIVGTGISGSSSGVNMIQSSKDAHGGYFVSFTHRKGFALTYNFTSDSAKEASFSLGLGNEIGVGMKFTDKSMTVNLNGTNLTFSDFTVYATGYRAYPTGKGILAQGANTLVVTIAEENEYLNGGTGGPTFDYVKVTSEANLSWTPKTSNLPDDE